jgi:hypothetical protein
MVEIKEKLVVIKKIKVKNQSCQVSIIWEVLLIQLEI